MKNLSILGCGDFLRWQSGDIQKTGNLKVRYLFDPDKSRAEKFAEQLGGQAAESAEQIFDDPETDIVALFIPPWIRRGHVEKAAAAGKHILTTKPLAASVDDCDAMIAAVDKAGVQAGLIYGRTGDSWAETTRDILEEGRFGKLALYRQDWLHAYPQWNDWATDPEKNGGPFMDAMIHNLNAARFLMGRPISGTAFFSDRLSHPDMRCGDTEQMIVRFQDNGLAHLFITWAADLATFNTEGNNREHIDLFYMVTDKGWRLTKEFVDGKAGVKASREGKEEFIPAKPLGATHYGLFVDAIEAGGALPRTLIDLQTAREDIALVRQKPVEL